MPGAVKLREDYSADALRGLARRSKDANHSRRLLSLAAVLEGMERGEAARIGGMDRQTLRDWVHRFNERGPEGLLDNWTSGPKSRLSLDQLAQLAAIVENWPRGEDRRGGALATRRLEARDLVPLRRRLPRALGRKASEETRFLARERAPAPSEARRAHRRVF